MEISPPQLLLLYVFPVLLVCLDFGSMAQITLEFSVFETLVTERPGSHFFPLAPSPL